MTIMTIVKKEKVKYRH